MAQYTANENLYKWSTSDTKQTTITEMASNANKIDAKLNVHTAQLEGNSLKEMFPDITYVDLEGRTVGNIVLSRTKVKLGTVTLA